MQKTLLTFLLGVVFATALIPSLQAQQEPMYSMYMFNGLAINPAYAGSRGALSLVGIYRSQWNTLPGAPVNQSFGAHMPTKNQRHGFGLNVVNDQISYIGQTHVSLNYAFRIDLGKSKLALGLRGVMQNHRINWDDADVKDQNDFVIRNYASNLVLPNAGFGMFWSGERFFAGASVPHLLVNSLEAQQISISLSDNSTNVASQRRHYFVTGGYVFPVTPDVKIKPSVLGKYVRGAPFQFDANLEVFFIDRIGVGASFRSGDGLVAMANFFITPQLRAGIAYDYPITGLSNYTWGSYEFMLSYDFKFLQDGVVSPRLF